MNPDKKRAIISDAGGILFDDSQRNNEEFDFLSSHVTVEQSQFKMGFYPFKMRAQTDPAYSRENAFCDYLRSIGRSDLEDAYKKYRVETDKRRPHPRELVFPDVLPFLTDVRRRNIPFIVVSDATRSAVEARITFYDPAGLSSYFTDLITSKDVGLKKPHSRLFDLVLAKHGLRKEDVLFIGHDYDELRGAAEYGFTVAAVRYKKELRAAGHLDFVLRSGFFLATLADLSDLVE